jgi:hypothetical protein
MKCANVNFILQMPSVSLTTFVGNSDVHPEFAKRFVKITGSRSNADISIEEETANAPPAICPLAENFRRRDQLIPETRS